MAAPCVSPLTQKSISPISALWDDGQKLSAAQLVSGTVYADLHPKTYGKDKEKQATSFS